MTSGTLEPSYFVSYISIYSKEFIFLTDRIARRIRRRPPCFKEGFALDDERSISSSIAIESTSACQEPDRTKLGLSLTQVVYNPHDQLKRTKISDGAYELERLEFMNSMDRNYPKHVLSVGFF